MSIIIRIIDQLKPVDVKDNTYNNFEKKLMIKILNLKLVIM